MDITSASATHYPPNQSIAKPRKTPPQKRVETVDSEPADSFTLSKQQQQAPQKKQGTWVMPLLLAMLGGTAVVGAIIIAAHEPTREAIVKQLPEWAKGEKKPPEVKPPETPNQTQIPDLTQTQTPDLNQTQIPNLTQTPDPNQPQHLVKRVYNKLINWLPWGKTEPLNEPVANAVVNPTAPVAVSTIQPSRESFLAVKNSLDDYILPANKGFNGSWESVKGHVYKRDTDSTDSIHCSIDTVDDVNQAIQRCAAALFDPKTMKTEKVPVHKPTSFFLKLGKHKDTVYLSPEEEEKRVRYAIPCILEGLSRTLISPGLSPAMSEEEKQYALLVLRYNRTLARYKNRNVLPLGELPELQNALDRYQGRVTQGSIPAEITKFLNQDTRISPENITAEDFIQLEASTIEKSKHYLKEIDSSLIHNYQDSTKLAPLLHLLKLIEAHHTQKSQSHLDVYLDQQLAELYVIKKQLLTALNKPKHEIDECIQNANRYLDKVDLRHFPKNWLERRKKILTLPLQEYVIDPEVKWWSNSGSHLFWDYPQEGLGVVN
jgi:hypothetical protein